MKMCGNNKDEKTMKNETKLSFCLEQCIVVNKPKTHTHTQESVAHLTELHRTERDKEKRRKNVYKLEMNSLYLEFTK